MPIHRSAATDGRWHPEGIEASISRRLGETPPETAFILAGGLATRMGSIAEATPKGMLPVGGRPFLEILIEDLARQAVEQVVLCVGHLGDRISAHFGDGHGFGLRVAYARESRPLGTGGALLAAVGTRNGPFLVLNGDSFARVDLRALSSLHRATAASDPRLAGTIVLSRMAESADYGRVTIGPTGWITAFEEKATARVPGLANAGVYLLERAALDRVPRGGSASLERDIFPGLSGRLRAHVTDLPFIDIGTPERYAAASASLAGILR